MASDGVDTGGGDGGGSEDVKVEGVSGIAADESGGGSGRDESEAAVGASSAGGDAADSAEATSPGSNGEGGECETNDSPAGSSAVKNTGDGTRQMPQHAEVGGTGEGSRTPTGAGEAGGGKVNDVVGDDSSATTARGSFTIDPFREVRQSTRVISEQE